MQVRRGGMQSLVLYARRQEAIRGGNDYWSVLIRAPFEHWWDGSTHLEERFPPLEKVR